MYETVRELIGKEPIPEFYDVEYQMPYKKIDNIEKELEKELIVSGLMERIHKGDRVAITAGSRGIANIVMLLRYIVSAVRARGAMPYIVAAMGSHGGATAEGQLAILTGYGITPENVGCEIISDMAVKKVGITASGMDVWMDRFAAGCDKIIIVGRVKAHTDFHGRVESGLAKMITIGLGKEKGADICHKLGFPSMSENVQAIANVALKNTPIVFGLAIIEDAFHNTAVLKGVPAECFEDEEPELLKLSKTFLPSIPYNKIDILIVDEIGKNISGAGMDPNITGRSPRLGIASPYAERILVRDIAEQSHGAGTGIGNADAITMRAFKHFSFDTTYPNGIASNDPESIKIPAVMPGDREAMQFVQCVLMGVRETIVPRIVWIRNTSDLSRIRVTSSLLEETLKNPSLKVVSAAQKVLFDDEGYVKGFLPAHSDP